MMPDKNGRKSHVPGHEANQLEAFLDSIQNRELESIQYFNHMTAEQNIHKIFHDGKMLPRKTDTPVWTRLARDVDSPVGVWFNTSLYASELPDTSTYGDNRVKIPSQFIVQSMFTPRLFLETFYYFESNQRNQIVRLILVDATKYPKETDWCTRRCLRRLNMLDNEILILDRDRKRYKCIKNDGVIYPHVWVEVLVVGEVEMVAIDTIEETSPSKLEATPGTVPPFL